MAVTGDVVSVRLESRQWLSIVLCTQHPIRSAGFSRIGLSVRDLGSTFDFVNLSLLLFADLPLDGEADEPRTSAGPARRGGPSQLSRCPAIRKRGPLRGRGRSWHRDGRTGRAVERS